ncbi:YfgM family protein [Halotalea alkalilenta]|uniref:YfgM family protein n=1 Tax=Halotalea alkalilenta TaxID=376489 RepID=UPI00048A11EC|nr:tetratricopeptide repeat protein [Halotalea alkalilenta]
MAQDLRDDDEQLDALKSWWKRHGTSLVAGVLLAAAGIFGWNAWQSHQANQTAAASQAFDQLIALTSDFNVLDDEQRAQVDQLAEQLSDDHGGTLYAELARLIQARVAVDANDPDTAMASLRQVIDGAKHDYVKAVARLDLARVQVDRQQYEEALANLEGELPEGLLAQQANVRGDAFQGLGRLDEARDAYRTALDLAKQHDLPIYGVQLKLDDLAPQEAS